MLRPSRIGAGAGALESVMVTVLMWMVWPGIVAWRAASARSAAAARPDAARWRRRAGRGRHEYQHAGAMCRPPDQAERNPVRRRRRRPHRPLSARLRHARYIGG